MQFMEPEIVQVTESVWISVLGLPMQPCLPQNIAPGSGRLLTGCVQITGAWFGAFTIHCSYNLARRIAASMFDAGDGSVSVRDIRDALAELANITGGNIKALLPPPCYLSLPVVVDGVEYVLGMPGSKPLTNLDFECDGEPFRVTLLKWDQPAVQ